MDKTNKTYNWNELKDKLPEHHPKESLWDAISSSIDGEGPKIEFSAIKDQLPEHQPSDSIWDNISKNLDAPTPLYDFGQWKDQLPSHEPSESVWENISGSLDAPTPTFRFKDYKDQLPGHEPSESVWENISDSLDKPAPAFQFGDYKDQLSEYTPQEDLWDKIESGLEVSDTIDQLPSHNPPENLWDQIEGELEEVQSGISYIRSAILIGISMLFIIGAAIMLTQGEATETQYHNELTPATENAEPLMFASNENIKVEWSDDEDVRLIQEMCQDYMAVCKQPQFKKLESELLELNEHKEELLELVSDFDEESSYGPLLAKIENQKTALMKEMISMI